MIPTTFITLDPLPLTPNRKIDRNALPNPDDARPTPPRMDPPRPGRKPSWPPSGRESSASRIGRHDDFFDLGGHSLSRSGCSPGSRPSPARYPLTALFRAPRPSPSFAESLRSKVGVALDLLGPCAASGSRQPFFYVSPFRSRCSASRTGVGTSVRTSRSTSCNLKAWTRDAPSTRLVEHMAAHYLKEMKDVQPCGPYWLGGHCAGAGWRSRWPANCRCRVTR